VPGSAHGRARGAVGGDNASGLGLGQALGLDGVTPPRISEGQGNRHGGGELSDGDYSESESDYEDDADTDGRPTQGRHGRQSREQSGVGAASSVGGSLELSPAPAGNIVGSVGQGRGTAGIPSPDPPSAALAFPLPLAECILLLTSRSAALRDSGIAMARLLGATGHVSATSHPLVLAANDAANAGVDASTETEAAQAAWA